MYKKLLHRLSIILLLSLLPMLTMPVMVLCSQPPSWPPPEEKWHPMPPEEARPEMRRINPYGGNKYVELGEAFFLNYGWMFFPTNVAYDLDTGEQVTTYWNLQDGTDQAYCKFDVTMNDKPLTPTNSFTGTCYWYRFPEGGRWLVAPTCVLYEYYIEFPQGLSEGTYEIILHGQRSGGEPLIFPPTFLHVG